VGGLRIKMYYRGWVRPSKAWEKGLDVVVRLASMGTTERRDEKEIIGRKRALTIVSGADGKSGDEKGKSRRSSFSSYLDGMRGREGNGGEGKRRGTEAQNGHVPFTNVHKDGLGGIGPILDAAQVEN